MRGLSNLGPRRLSALGGRQRLGVDLALFLLRLTIVLRGVPAGWPDEDRFAALAKQLDTYFAGETLAALRGVTFASPEHILFRILAIFPALLEVRISRPLLGCLESVLPRYRPQSLWSIGRLAIAAGGSDMEQCFVLMVGLSCASLFYYSRHFFPYDLSLLFLPFCQGALAFRPNRSFWLSFRGLSLWVACGFLVYNRYWTACGGDWGPISWVCLPRAADSLQWHPRRIFRSGSYCRAAPL